MDSKRDRMNELIKLKLKGEISAEEANRRFAEIQNPVVSKFADKSRVLELVKQCVSPQLQASNPVVNQQLSGAIDVSFNLSKEDGYCLLVVFEDDRVASEIAMPTTKTEADFVDMEKLQLEHDKYMLELSKQASKGKTDGLDLKAVSETHEQTANASKTITPITRKR